MVSFSIVEGNPGALTFLMEAYKRDPFKAERAFQRMQDAGIRGSKIYMLWNDCCGRDTDWTMNIMIDKDVENIIEHINYEGGRGIRFEREEEERTNE